uniref:Uncharacterized protein n=1 Tax=Haptolina ericina TaxID=156174 RepID=A0A7S3AF42_9EUKA|mmetsp:Transcript_15774/g.35396  ORF Transcript_15774/g.35396 Transcript_15774/m.35396 type:complete len:164 (+) Transcript_15774:209-700(+)
MQLDLELEAEFDAQAFSSGEAGSANLRAIKVRISDGMFVIQGEPLACSATAVSDFQRMASELLADGECCYVLFRTAAWALFSFVPGDAPLEEQALYTQEGDTLRTLLGGRLRIPNTRCWTSRGEVQLQDEIERAPPLSMREVVADPANTRAVIAGSVPGSDLV